MTRFPSSSLSSLYSITVPSLLSSNRGSDPLRTSAADDAGYPFLPESTVSTHITSLPHHIETPLSATLPLLQSTVPYPVSHEEKSHITTDPECTQKTIKHKSTTRKK